MIQRYEENDDGFFSCYPFIQKLKKGKKNIAIYTLVSSSELTQLKLVERLPCERDIQSSKSDTLGLKYFIR